MSDFQDVTHDPFGISKDFNTIIGNNFTSTHIDRHKTISHGRKKAITNDMVKAYNKFIKHDKKNSDNDTD